MRIALYAARVDAVVVGRGAIAIKAKMDAILLSDGDRARTLTLPLFLTERDGAVVGPRQNTRGADQMRPDLSAGFVDTSKAD
ncbi:hypothetical protein ACFIOY_02500 [Bradyrhizobium sp. TZ2]